MSLKIVVNDGATLETNCTIVCGVKIGKFALIGTRLIVTKDVDDYALYVGVPTKRVGWVSQSGIKLGKDLICPSTKEKYVFRKPEVSKKLNNNEKNKVSRLAKSTTKNWRNII